MDSASTWDSYKDSLMKVLNNFIPRRVMEWGSGESTVTIMDHKAVETIDSVEHNIEWAERLKHMNHGKLNLIYEPDENLYPFVSGRYDKYDLIFVDGIRREICLNLARVLLTNDGIVVLHDAKRPQYRHEIDQFKYAFWQDGGHTVILTNNIDTATRLKEVLVENSMSSA